jgi:hypothetical protein
MNKEKKPSNSKPKDLSAVAEAFQNDFIADQERAAGENSEILAQINNLKAQIAEINDEELNEKIY